MAPRNHAGFSFVFLLDERNPTAGPIYVHTFQMPPANDGRSRINNWAFEKSQSVYGAARTVATWIREQRENVGKEGS